MFVKYFFIGIGYFLFAISCIFMMKASSIDNFFSCNRYEWLFSNFKFANNEIYTVSASIIAAYIFYIVNGYFPRKIIEKEYKTQLTPMVEDIILEVSSVFRKINDLSNEKTEFPIRYFSIFSQNSSHIDFDDLYDGFMFIVEGSKPFSVIEKSIKYNIETNLHYADKKLKNLILSGRINDYKFLKLSRELEVEINKCKENISMFYNMKSRVEERKNNFHDYVMFLNSLHKKAGEFTKYYNNNIRLTKVYCDGDIWFDKKTRESFKKH